MGSDVLLGHEDGKPVFLRYDCRTAHVAILGKSRFGKTTLLEHLLLADMQASTAAIVLDAHGDLTKRLISLAPLKARDSLILVEPNDERPFGLNLYACPDPSDARVVTATVGHVVDIFNKLMGSESTAYRPVIDSGLRNTARALIANGLTMAEISPLYNDPAFRHAALCAIPTHSDYWREYELSDARKQQEKREPVLNKVARFLEDGLISLMVSQDKTTIPVKQVMDEGGTLIINLAGLDRDTVSFLGMVFLSVLSNLVHQRESITDESKRNRVHLYLDEYGRFATPTTKRLLEEGGKYGLGVTIAHQNLSQTPEREALGVETLIAFQLSGEDKDAVAMNLDTTPTRTKKVLKQRTESQYREWDEEVWDSNETKTHYEALVRERDEAKRSAQRAERILYLLEEGLNSRYTYLGFDYDGSFPFDKIRAGELPLPITGDDSPISWHKPFNPATSYFRVMVESGKKVTIDKYTRNGLVDFNAFYEFYFLPAFARKHSWFRKLVTLAISRSDDHELIDPLLDELSQLLLKPYESEPFAFVSSEELDRVAALPALGEERSIETCRTWFIQGKWVPRQFPTAVAWLAEKVAGFYRELDHYKELKARCEREVTLHRSIEHRKEHIGEKPSQETVRGSKMVRSIFPGGTSYPMPYEHQVNAQWFDYVEELDQTHADRQAEIANILTQLPRYVAYCKIMHSDSKPHEHLIQTLPPANAEEQVEKDYFDNQLKRALRISKRIRSGEPLDIHQFHGPSPEIGKYFKQDEFRREMSDFMHDWRYGARRAKRSPITPPPLEIEHVRRRSRDHYGTPSEQVEEEIRDRRARLFGRHGSESPDSAKKSASLPVDLAQATARAKWQREHLSEQNPEANRSARPPIGRRSPKRPGEAGASRARNRNVASALDRLAVRGEIRVCELAEELGVESAVVMEELDKLNLFARSPNSILKESAVQTLILAFRQHPQS